MFNNREEEAKREKDHERKAKYVFLVAAIKGRDQPSPSHPKVGLKIPWDPASNATSQDIGQRHARTHGPPQKHAQSVVNGDTGRWTVSRDVLAPLGRSPPPKPGEWNVHRDAPVPLARSPHLPRTPAQPYESCCNDMEKP